MLRVLLLQQSHRGPKALLLQVRLYRAHLPAVDTLTAFSTEAHALRVVRATSSPATILGDCLCSHWEPPLLGHAQVPPSLRLATNQRTAQSISAMITKFNIISCTPHAAKFHSSSVQFNNFPCPVSPVLNRPFWARQGDALQLRTRN